MDSSENTRDLPSAGVPSGLITAVLVLLLTGAALAALLLSLFDPAKHNFYPFCLFHKATGWLCPGCGSLRAMHHLLNGEIVLALKHNVLVMLSLPLFLLLGARLVISSLGRRLRPLLIPNRYIWAGLGLLLLFGIMRNLPFAQAIWLAP